MSGQSIVDRLNAAKHTVAGSALGRAVVKATTEEVLAPKRKHLDYLLQATSEINVSIPQMADLLIERTQNTSWVVTFKSLITIHNLMCYGNERFSQYMASHNSKFLLNNFIDKSGVQGVDMSSYIRRYAGYLNEKRETYKLMGFDFCKVKRGKDDGMLRTMQTEKLLKTIPILHQQLEALIHFDIQPNELTNSVINACFVLLSKDLIRLFACYNDGIINLLEKYFDMNKKNCKDALDMYKRFLDSTDKVSAFLKVAENAGMDKSDIPDLTKAPSSLLEALEAHLNSLENKKTTSTTQINGQASSAQASTTSSAAAASKTPSSVAHAINSLSSNVQLSAEEKRRVIEEEAKTLESFKSSLSDYYNAESNHLKKQTSLSSPTNENNNKNNNIEDLFNMDFNNKTTTSPQQQFSLPQQQRQQQQQQQQQQQNQNNKPSDDLLLLNTNATTGPFGQQQMNLFPQSQAHLDFDAFGDVLQPMNLSSNKQQQQTSAETNNKQNGGEKKLLSTDIDSSLASLADNLDINYKNKGLNKNHQWTQDQQQSQLKTGGNDWKPMKPVTTNAFAPQPIIQAAPVTMQPPMWNPMVTTAGVPMTAMMPNAAQTSWNNPFMTPATTAAAPLYNMSMQQQLAARPLQPQMGSTSSNNPFGF